jgi:hypothetical protein
VATYLHPVADREPLAWILHERKTAFGEHREREARALAADDRLLIYATRGCFRNPTRDRGRVIAAAVVSSAAAALAEEVAFRGHKYTVGVDLQIERLAPRRDGVELAPLVGRLRAFPDPRSWSARMRRALVPLPDKDASLLERELAKLAPPYPEALESYAMDLAGSTVGSR